MNDETRTLLKERTDVYGDYKGGCRFIIDTMTIFRIRHEDVNNTPVDPTYEQFVRDIVNKLSRIAVTPDHVDSWRDIAGYATLAADAIEEEQNANK